MEKDQHKLVAERFAFESSDARNDDLPPSLVSILRRRTHRRFEDRPIDERTFQTLLACALSSPSKSDLQQLSIVRVKDPEARAAIASWIPSMPWIGTCPEFLVFCADHRRIRRICAQRGHDFSNDNLDGFVNATIDAALALETFVLAAESVGLGCCPISVLRDHIDKATDLLGLPECVYPIAGLCIGHPAAPGHLVPRLPPSVTVHVDRYDDTDLEQQVADYDRRRDAIYSIPVEKQKSTDRYGVSDDYTWSEDKARQESLPERDGFRTFLESRGFALS